MQAAETTAANGATGPLAGVRVVDLTTVLMGPYATQILGDLGADVIKIEAPGGDGSRGIGPMRNPGMGAFYVNANRNKRSVVLNLKSPQGHAALMRLIAQADVLVSNVRPQALARLNLAYEDALMANPRIIHVSCHGFGQGGPYADRPAYDDLIQGAVGIPALALAAGADKPRYVPFTLADRAVGLTVVNAVTAALFHRERTGEGQAISVPMFETMVDMVMGDHLGGATFDPPLGPTGYARLLSSHRRPYATKDGYISAVVYTDAHWQKFFEMIGRADVVESDPRFADMSTRTAHIDALYGMVSDVIGTRTTSEWVEALNAIDIPVMPIHSPDSLLEDRHLQAVGFFKFVDHPTEGRVRSMSIPSTWTKTQPTVTRLAARLGEHTEEVLREIGMSNEEIAAVTVQ